VPANKFRLFAASTLFEECDDDTQEDLHSGGHSSGIILVVGALAFVQKLNNDQISNIVVYELPLTRLVSEFDVDTDKYELVILRELREDSSNSQSLKTATSTVQPSRMSCGPMLRLQIH
jgi:hypothetical protein